MDFIIHTGTYLLHFMCVFLDVQTNSISSIWKSYPIGQIFFKEGLILLVWGNSYYSKELFEHSINTIQTREGTPHHFFVRTTNDVTTHHYFYRPQLFSSKRCFCVFKCIFNYAFKHFFFKIRQRYVIQFMV